MNQPTFGNISSAELEAVLDHVFSEEFGDLTTDQFFDGLAALDAAEPTQRIEIPIRLEHGRVIPQEVAGIKVQENEIWVGDKRLVLRLQTSVG
jgi:hypothetical protein